MIGRATVGKPWIFKEIREYIASGDLIPPLMLRDKVDLARLQFHKSLEVKGFPRGIYEMRRHFSNYFKGLPDFRDIRMKLVTTLDGDEIENLLDLILVNYPQY